VARSGVSVTVKGRLFTMSSQETRILANNIIQEIATIGEGELNRLLRPRPGGVYLSVAQAGKGKASTGHYRRNLRVRRRDLYARIDDGGVVYGPWLERGAGGTRFRGYASFRRTGQFMRRQVKPVATKHLDRFVKRMGG